jgi:beta-lactamase superfamily II metal-dependent hydrolase
MATTDWPELTILDVGHANCAVVRDGDRVFVIDVPLRGSELLEALDQQGVTEISAVLISHGDADHVGGVSALLADETLTIHRVYLNPEALRDTKAWTALRLAVRDARTRSEQAVRVHTALTSTTAEELQLPRLKTEILAPSPELAMSGAGGTSMSGNRLSTNTMSVVIRFSTEVTEGVMLAGDIDRVGLDEMLAEHPSPTAEVLVFPHHGGLPGRAQPHRFASTLTAAVTPSVVVFSLGSDSVTPRPEIVAGVRESAPLAHVACTELGGQCALQPPHAPQSYLSARPARGISESHSGSACAGTLEFRFLPDRLDCQQLPGHAEWVTMHVPERLCALASPPPRRRIGAV